MRILTITAQYPPDHAGGYELRVEDIMDGLHARGHEIFIISTKAKKRRESKEQQAPYPVIRLLHDRNRARFFPKELLFDLIDTQSIKKTIEVFHPDLIYLGHTYILSKAILPFLAGQDISIVYDEGGNGLKGAWTDHGRWFEFAGEYRSRFRILNFIKPAVVRLVMWMSRGRINSTWSFPDKMKIFFNSELNRSNARYYGIPVENAQVIHSGVDTERFTFIPKQNLFNPIKILIPGRIETKKGQLAGVTLLHNLSNRGIEAELFLVGPSSSDGYIDNVKNEIDKFNLAEKVHIIPMINKDQMVELYHKSDICFFSSYHHSGFSRVPLEAMACGCLVVSYGNEGSDEIIRDQENGYLVEEGNLPQVAQIIQRLVNDSAEVERITKNARQEIEQHYSMTKYIDQNETFLKWTLSQS